MQHHAIAFQRGEDALQRVFGMRLFRLFLLVEDMRGFQLHLAGVIKCYFGMVDKLFRVLAVLGIKGDAYMGVRLYGLVAVAVADMELVELLADILGHFRDCGGGIVGYDQEKALAAGTPYEFYGFV